MPTVSCAGSKCSHSDLKMQNVFFFLYLKSWTNVLLWYDSLYRISRVLISASLPPLRSLNISWLWRCIVPYKLFFQLCLCWGPLRVLSLLLNCVVSYCILFKIFLHFQIISWILMLWYYHFLGTRLLACKLQIAQDCWNFHVSLSSNVSLLKLCIITLRN